MLLAFIDSCVMGEEVSYGAFIISHEAIMNLDDKYQSYLKKLGADLNDPDWEEKCELKWNDDKKNIFWRARQGKHLEKAAFAKEMKDAGGSFLFFLSHGHKEKSKNEAVAFDGIIELIESFSDASKQLTLVVSDADHDRKDQIERVKRSKALIKEGTEYISIEYLYKHMFCAQSHWHPGISLADLIAGIGHRVSNKGDDVALEAFNICFKESMWSHPGLDSRCPQKWGFRMHPYNKAVIERLRPYPVKSKY